VALEFATARLSLIEEWASLRRIVASLVRRKPTMFTASPVKTGDLVRPSEGFDTLYGAVEESLRAAGVGILTACAIRSVCPSKNGFAVELVDEVRHYDRVVSTIPLSTMSQLVGLPFPEGVEYAKLFSLFYRFSGDAGHDATLLHNFTLDGLWKRVTTFSLYYSARVGEQYFVVEGTLKENVELDEALLRKDFESHVRRLGLYRGMLKYQGCIRTDHAYPVYRLGNLERVLAAKTKLRELGIDLAGRQGEFDYISSSDAAGGAQKLARAILGSLPVP
jgi:protoporphyrinogen oxidase